MKWTTSPIFPLKADTKAPLIKWQRDKERRPSIDEAHEFPDLGFAPPQGYVILDADASESEKGKVKPREIESYKVIKNALDKLGLKVFEYETNNGVHFVFRVPQEEPYITKVGNNIGGTIFKHPIDVKGNGKGYVKIKENGVDRVSTIKLIEEFEKAPMLPVIFSITKPMKIKLDDYEKGDRDNTLFRWIPKLRSKGWTQKMWIEFVVSLSTLKGDTETVDELIEWANQKWQSSVDMGEVKDFLPDSGTDKTSAIYSTFKRNSKGVMSMSTVSKYDILYGMIADEYELSFNPDNNQVWGNYNGRIQPIIDVKYLISKFYIVNNVKNVDPSVIDKVAKGIIPHLKEKKLNPRKLTVSFKNKTFDVLKYDEVSDKEFDEYITTNQIPWNLISKTELQTTHAEAEKFLNSMMHNWTLKDKDLEKELYEMIGLSMTKYMNEDKAYFLLGNASNGKSWFLDMVEEILGTYNVSNEDLNMLSNNPFSSAQLLGKLANINADISSTIINDTSIFKRFTSGDMMSAQFKGQQAFSFKPFATPIFGTNDVPAARETGDSDAIDRRLKILPFRKKFKTVVGAEKIKLKEKLLSKEVLEVAIYKSVEALYHAIQSGFTESKASKSALENHKKETNHIISFIETNPISSRIEMKRLYNNYKVWTKENGYQYLGQQNFDKKYIKVARDKGAIINKINIDGKNFYEAQFR